MSCREAVIDFETRSRADLRKLGSFRYSQHPTTQINCLAWSYDDEPDVYVWHPEYPEREIIPAMTGRKIHVQEALPEEGREELEELFDRIALDGILVHAWNVFFERSIWEHVGARRLGWPSIDPGQLRCIAALAASYALPRRLEDACKALKLAQQKDMGGHRLMLKLAREAGPTKQDILREWHEKQEELYRLFEYCAQDVIAERAVLRQLAPLRDDELLTWQIDQEINWRGVYLDREMIDAALRLAKEETAEANAELADLTFGAVTKATQVAQLKAWLREEGLNIPDMRAATVDHFLSMRDEIPEHLVRALECRKVASYTSVKKYQAMRNRMCEDDRVRDILRYHAASTGRWGGVGIQPQNFPRGYGDPDPKKGKPGIDEVCEDIKTLPRRELRAKYGGERRSVMELISLALRGAITAPPGFELAVADYSSIEAVVLFWIAGDRKALKILAEGGSLYKDLAGQIYGIADSQNAVSKGTPEYQIGKMGILGLGYQMAWKTFVKNCESQGTDIEPEFAKRVVDTYRSTYPKVKSLWYAMEDAAIEAVRRGRGGRPVPCRNTQWAWRGRFLYCKLPSGRLLAYCDPWLGHDERFDKDKVQFWGIDTYTKKWCEQDTYGGKLVENVVQATARDLMRDAMLRIDAEDDNHDFVLTVHDELVAEVMKGRGSQEEFEEMMAAVPDWAKGCPVSVEGWRKERYRK